MIKIDGSTGEGGGQVIRSALALSMLTGKPFEIINVRGKRKNAGLARQHLTCVNAAAQICGGEAIGAALKSSHLVFRPGPVVPGNYQFAIGTAGSTTLVAQTVLPALLAADQASVITIEGGTHNMLAPPYEFFDAAYLHIINRLGPTVTGKLIRHGFYPAGGGSIEIHIQPTKHWTGIQLLERKKVNPFVTTVLSGLPASIGDRAVSTICRKADWPVGNSEVVDVPSPRGPGMIVMIRLECGETVEVFSEVGKPGVKTEQLARKVLREARRFLKLDVPVGPHLADQLMLPMAIAADGTDQRSGFRTGPLTGHSLTHIDIIGKFLDVNIAVTEDTNETVLVTIGGDEMSREPLEA